MISLTFLSVPSCQSLWGSSVLVASSDWKGLFPQLCVTDSFCHYRSQHHNPCTVFPWTLRLNGPTHPLIILSFPSHHLSFSENILMSCFHIYFESPLTEYRFHWLRHPVHAVIYHILQHVWLILWQNMHSMSIHCTQESEWCTVGKMNISRNWNSGATLLQPKVTNIY